MRIRFVVRGNALVLAALLTTSLVTQAGAQQDPAGSVSGMVELVHDGSGNRVEAAPVSGITVRMEFVERSEAGVAVSDVAEVVTDQDGRWSFEGLSGGEYRVDFTGLGDRAPVIRSADISSDAGRLIFTGPRPRVPAHATVQLVEAGQMVYDIGLEPVGSIQGQIFRDLGPDGQRGANDPPMAGVTVTGQGSRQPIDDDEAVVVLQAADDSIDFEVVSDAEGRFDISFLPYGAYHVRVQEPEGMATTLEGLGDEATDSDVRMDNSTVLLVGATEPDVSFDIGLAAVATLRGRVFHDADGDGLLGAGERLAEYGSVFIDSYDYPPLKVSDSISYAPGTDLNRGFVGVAELAPDGTWTFDRALVGLSYLVTVWGPGIFDGSGPVMSGLVPTTQRSPDASVGSLIGPDGEMPAFRLGPDGRSDLDAGFRLPPVASPISEPELLPLGGIHASAALLLAVLLLVAGAAAVRGTPSGGQRFGLSSLLGQSPGRRH